MAKDSLFEKIMRAMKGEQVLFTANEESRRERLMYVLETKMQNLWLTDFRLYKKIQQKYPSVTFPQVTSDVTLVERMIATDKDPHGDPQKVWIRYFLTQVSMDAIRLARSKDDPYTMTIAANVIGRHWKTDKEDVVIPPYDKIVPFNPIMTTNPAKAGITRMSENEFDELRIVLRAHYNLEADSFMKSISISEVEEANVIEEDEDET